MPYDEHAAARVRKAISKHGKATEKKMFGGLAFMLKDAMCCGLVGDDLVARVGPDRYEEALAHDDVRPMDFTGKPLTGYVYVAPAAYEHGAALSKWVRWSAEFVTTLPPKKKAKKKSATSKRARKGPR